MYKWIAAESRLKVNCMIEFELARPTVGRPAQMFSYNLLSVYNSLLAAIHLYMIRPLAFLKKEPSFIFVQFSRKMLTKICHNLSLILKGQLYIVYIIYMYTKYLVKVKQFLVCKYLLLKCNFSTHLLTQLQTVCKHFAILLFKKSNFSRGLE